MNNQEAINQIKEHMKAHKMKERNAIFIILALKMAIKALEKQIPAKGIMRAIEGYTYQEAHQLCCPRCHNAIRSIFSLSRFMANYCPYCGQALDWRN